MVSLKENGRFSLVRNVSGIVRDTIWNPLGLAFKASKRLSLMSDPSGRDVKLWNSQVLDRIDIDLLGKLAMKGRVQIWIGLVRLVL